MATVTHVENADGSHSIGVEIGKHFVPFVTLSGYYVAQLVENAANAAKAAKARAAVEES